MRKFLYLIFACACCLFVQASDMAYAISPTDEIAFVVSNDNKSDWAEVQSIVIPFDTPIFEGVTKSGNVKYYFTFKDIGDVAVSESSAQKFKDKSANIELVKWYSSSKDSYKYSTRQVRNKRRKAPNINLTELF